MYFVTPNCVSIDPSLDVYFWIRTEALNRCYSIPGYADLPLQEKNRLYDRENLTVSIARFAYDHDYYEFMDCYDSFEDCLADAAEELNDPGKLKDNIRYLENYIEEGGELSDFAEQLIYSINRYMNYAWSDQLFPVVS